MKRLFLFVSLTLAACAPLLAQTPNVALSKAFDEPDNGANRLLLLQNGSTLYFHFTPDNGIRVAVYDDKHQQRAQTTLAGKTWDDRDMKRSELKGIYEINGQAVIFLQQIDHKTPYLFRIVVDPKTGRVAKEDQIGELPKYNFWDGYALAWGSVKEHDFYVEKDPESDYYAVVQFNSFASSSDERIQVVHYSPEHKEINRAFYELPDKQFKYLDYQAIYVHKDDYVFIAAYGYNSGKAKDAKLIISKLAKGSKSFQHETLAYTEGFRQPQSGIQYDAPHQTIRLLTITNAKNLDLDKSIKYHNREYVMMMSYIDPAQLKVTHHNYIEDTYVTEYAQSKLHFKHDYVGMPQDYVLNPDGTSTIMLEELKQISHTNSSSGVGGSFSSSTYWTTEFNDIGIAKINALGQEVSGYAIAKSQETYGYFSYWHNYQRDRGAWSFRRNGLMGNHNLAPFFSYQYLHPLNTDYVIFNDYNKNIRDQSESYRDKKEMHYASETSTVCYRRSQDGTMDKFFLYGDPGDQDINRYTILESTIHTPDQKKMVTIMVEKDGRREAQAHIAWIDFE